MANFSAVTQGGADGAALCFRGESRLNTAPGEPPDIWPHARRAASLLEPAFERGLSWGIGSTQMSDLQRDPVRVAPGLVRASAGADEMGFNQAERAVRLWQTRAAPGVEPDVVVIAFGTE